MQVRVSVSVSAPTDLPEGVQVVEVPAEKAKSGDGDDDDGNASDGKEGAEENKDGEDGKTNEGEASTSDAAAAAAAPAQAAPAAQTSDGVKGEHLLSSMVGQKVYVKVSVVACNALPTRTSSNVYAVFKWYNCDTGTALPTFVCSLRVGVWGIYVLLLLLLLATTPADFATQCSPYRTINPKLNYTIYFACTITPDFLRHLAQDTLDLFVYGSGDSSAAQVAPEEGGDGYAEGGTAGDGEDAGKVDEGDSEAAKAAAEAQAKVEAAAKEAEAAKAAADSLKEALSKVISVLGVGCANCVRLMVSGVVHTP